jgi:hypothetical protein
METADGAFVELFCCREAIRAWLVSGVQEEDDGTVLAACERGEVLDA